MRSSDWGIVLFVSVCLIGAIYALNISVSENMTQTIDLNQQTSMINNKVKTGVTILNSIITGIVKSKGNGTLSFTDENNNNVKYKINFKIQNGQLTLDYSNSKQK